MDETNPAMKFTEASVHTYIAHGLFAIKEIPKDYVIGEYVGLIRKYDDCQRNTDLETELNQTTLFDLIESQKWGPGRSNAPIGDTLVIDPATRASALIYMNDFRSDDMDRKQNVSYHEILVNGWPHIFAIAKEKINIKSELLTDYGKAWWENFRIIMKRQNQLKQLKKNWEDEHKAGMDALTDKNTQLQQQVSVLKEQLKETQQLKEENKRLRKVEEMMEKMGQIAKSSR